MSIKEAGGGGCLMDKSILKFYFDYWNPSLTFLPEHSRFDQFRQVQGDQSNQEKTKIDQILVLKGTVRI